jgi:hypothetical protein
MRPSKAHFVTSCQQLLALGVVLAALTPAATVVSLDVVQRTPRQDAPTGLSAPGEGRRLTLSAYAAEGQLRSRVPTAPVAAELTEYPLTVSAGDARSPRTSRTTSGERLGTTSVLSRPAPVVGYGGVGVTWAPGQVADDEDRSFTVRTRTDGAWSPWTELEYHDEHAPDPDSPEGRHARPGTDVLFVGRVDDVQVRADADGVEPPAGMSLSVVGPGDPADTRREAPAIDTDARAAARSTAPTAGVATVTPRPRIYSRAQWGADESLRDKGSLRYFEVHAGFVHHTVNANGYSRDEVPGLLRSIYAYHTQSRGWSDVGYNFLVDRFGRIWEGRHGGVDRPVVGAHTLGYNDYSFAMSAIGNFDVTEPSSAMVQAYGALMAWKLSLHGVDAADTSQRVGPDTFPAVNGHRDAGQTACPGRYLYAKLGRIRELADSVQEDWAGRDLHSDLAATDHPDLVVRRATDGKVFVLPTGGFTGMGRPSVSTGLASDADTVVATPDLTGDRVGDLLVRHSDGSAALHPGDGTGGYAAATRTWGTAFAGRSLVTAVGDLDGDGDADLVARDADGRPAAYLGDGTGALARQRLDGDWSGWTSLAATGDVDGDGHADLLARDAAGALWLLPGTGTASGAAFGSPVRVAGDWSRWASVTGHGDFTRDGRPDLLVRAEAGAPAYVLPGRAGATFGDPLGPITRLERAGTVVGAAQYADGAMPDAVSVRGGDVRTFPNLDTTELLPPVPAGFAVGTGATLLNVGDWDRDGDGDVVVRTAKGVLLLRQNNGAGSFPEKVRIGRGFADVRLLAAVGDATGDGWPDLMGQPVGGSMRLYPGNGLLGVEPGYVAHSAISAARQVGVGRWDGDGAPDTLLRSGDTLSVYPGNGPGGLTGRQALGFDATRYDWVLGVSDLRLTGHGDLVVREKATGRLYALTVTAKKGITSRRLLGQGMEVYDRAG